jgi:hypothetical protein
VRRNWLRELRYPVGFGGVAAPFRAGPGLVALLARGTGGVDVAGVDAAVTGPAPRGGAVPGSAVRVCDEAPSWRRAVLDAVGAFHLWRVLLRGGCVRFAADTVRRADSRRWARGQRGRRSRDGRAWIGVGAGMAAVAAIVHRGVSMWDEVGAVI